MHTATNLPPLVFAQIANFSTNNHHHTFTPSPHDEILATRLTLVRMCLMKIYAKIRPYYNTTLVVVDVNNLKNGRN